jgi:hypothetical protein
MGIVLAFAGLLYGYMLVSAHYYKPKTLFGSIYGRNCAEATILQRILGYLCLSGAGYSFYSASLGMAIGSVGPVIIGGVLAAGALYAFGHPFKYSEEE